MDDDTLPEPDALAALLAADAAHGDGYGWLSSRALAPDGTDQPMNLQRKTMYRDIDGFDAAEVPAVMASFVSLFLRTEAVRQFGLPIAEFFIWSTPAAFPAQNPAMSSRPAGSCTPCRTPAS